MSMGAGASASILLGLALAAGAFYLRTRGLARGEGQGGDAWYYLLYVEELRRTRRIPVKLPYFLLDIEEQWYPVGFPLLLGLLPRGFLRRYRWAVTPGLDCLQLLILYLFTLVATHSTPSAALAGAVYATTPTLIAENLNLNSRSLGSLLFTLSMLSVSAMEVGALPWGYLPVGAFGGALLLTHKLSSQAFVFVLLGEALLARRTAPLLDLAVCAAAAFLLSKGFFFKVLKGHGEILWFWRRNLHNLGAHQVYDSLLYPTEGAPRPSPRFHQPGLAGLVRHGKVLLVHDLYLLALPLLLLDGGPSPPAFFFRWILLVYLWALATTFLPPLRFLGEGVKYLKLAVFPLAFVLGMWAGGLRGLLLVPFLALNLYVVLRRVQSSQLGKLDEGLLTIVEYMKGADPGGVMAIPAHAADAIAYLARRKVMWGAHSSGYDRLEPFFPVLRQPVQAFFSVYDLRFLLLDRRYVDPRDLDLQCFVEALRSGAYLLYRYQPAGRGTQSRGTAASGAVPCH